MDARLFLLLGVALPCVMAIYCPPNACQEFGINCPSDRVCKGELRPSGGGMCGCCTLCVITLGEGDVCFDMRAILLGAPVYERNECGQGLACNTTSGRCERIVQLKRAPVGQSCAARHADLAAQIQQHILEHGSPPLGSELPRCDSDGTYSPVQCLGSACYCVLADGSRLEGYSVDRWESQEMNCECARSRISLRVAGFNPAMYTCLPNGNYAPMQCRDPFCFCVDAFGNRVGHNATFLEFRDRLNC